ncbi:hypothetical protein Nepgr_021215 [Nepenthes gracilis]|uniref:Uncharacterized protein n=1 Tax=Nepenthes gracilis TaxID=150966 RepID=A0AAD3SYA7_NEPGR|nr:hypothetical protein Nepgr_021215 [Nepenthes gracilis]
MVDWEEVKVDTGQVSYPHLLPIPVCRKSTSTLSKCPSSELPPPFSSMKCGEGDSILLATTNSTTPILRTMGVCVNRKKARARREWLECQRSTVEGALRVFDDIDRHVAILQLLSSFTEKPSRTAHTIPDSVHGIFQRADGLVLKAMYLTAIALQQLSRLIELTSVCCVRLPKLFAVSWLYSGEEEASPSLSVKIEAAYIPINQLEEAWAESDGIMWDLAANQYPERLIGANWVLEVLLVGLGIISPRIIGKPCFP